jgi:hypothetical protein
MKWFLEVCRKGERKVKDALHCSKILSNWLIVEDGDAIREINWRNTQALVCEDGTFIVILIWGKKLSEILDPQISAVK